MTTVRGTRKSEIVLALLSVEFRVLTPDVRRDDAHEREKSRMLGAQVGSLHRIRIILLAEASLVAIII